MKKARYQLLDRLSREEYTALESDILKRGVQVAIEFDTDGNVLDGHHRKEIAERHGLRYPKKVRRFKTEAEKREHVIKLNLARRQLEPHKWGKGFDLLYDLRLKNAIKEAATNDTPTMEIESATLADTAAECGVSPRTASSRRKAASQYKALSATERKAVDRKEKSIQQIERERKESTRETRRKKNAALVAKAPTPTAATRKAKFATIVIDPPWDWGDEKDCDQLGRARPTYDTMPIAKLLAYPVQDFADVDCHLYLWITNRSLAKGFALLDAWGFRYVTCLTWCKPSIGMGNYFRGSTEQILFGVKGMQPLKKKNVGTWFAAPRGGEHSAKPAAFYKLVEACSPGPYLDVFARQQRGKLWTCIGAEI